MRSPELKDLLAKVHHVPDVIAVYLFGSHARGEARKSSDIDVCIITKDMSFEQEAEIAGWAKSRTDVSFFQRLSLPIRFRVFHEGKELYVKDERLLGRIKFRTIKEYLDIKPILERMYRAALSP